MGNSEKVAAPGMPGIPSAPVRLSQIARKAGVSPATVSIVLNRRGDIAIADATRRKVMDIAHGLGYQREGLARSILQPLRYIAIAVGDAYGAHETFTASIFEGIQRELHARGYHALFHLIDSPAVHVAGAEGVVLAAAQKIVEASRSRLIDGLVLDKQYFPDKAVRGLAKAAVPLVTVNGGQLSDARDRPVASVTIDDFKAGRLTAAHLIELRHRRVALVSRPFQRGPRAYESTPVRNFRLGYESALADAGIQATGGWTVEADMLDKEATYRAVESVMALTDRPTALVCGDDQIAAMAINALRRLGLRVPEDASVMGCGNLPVVGRLVDPGLSTVALPLEENGRRAAGLLIDLIEGRPVSQPQVVLNPELIIRQSTSINRDAM